MSIVNFWVAFGQNLMIFYHQSKVVVKLPIFWPFLQYMHKLCHTFFLLKFTIYL